MFSAVGWSRSQDTNLSNERLYFVSGFLRAACKLFWVGRSTRRSAGRSAGRPAGRPGGARVVKTRGVRGAAAPWLNPSRGGVWGGEAPQPKLGGSGGQRPPAKTEKFSKLFRIFLKNFETKKNRNVLK